MIKKFIIILIVVNLYPLIGQAQSYVGVILGYDFSRINETNAVPVDMPDDGYSKKSFFYGLKLEQQLSKSFILSVQGNYTKKDVPAIILNFVPLKGYSFKYYRSSIRLKWRIVENWHIGMGATFNLLANINLVPSHGDEVPYMQDKKEYGGVLSVGYRYENFIAEVFFNKNIVITSKGDELSLFKPINSLGFCVNYRIKIFDKPKKRNRKDCPEF